MNNSWQMRLFMVFKWQNERKQCVTRIAKIVCFASFFLLANAAHSAAAPGSYESPGPFPQNSNRKEQLDYLLKIANHYYKEPYHDIKNTKTSDNAKIAGRLIFRANHGLAHGVRQAALALDFIEMVKQFGDVNNSFYQEVMKALAQDQWFLDKTGFLMMLSRTGRGSEVGFAEDAQANYDYTDLSIDIFKKEAPKLELFSDWQIPKYANALKWLPHPRTNRFTRALNTIFRTAHILDLRRISNMQQYNSAKLKHEVLELWDQWGAIFDPAKKSGDEVFDMLWTKAGQYLNATGDRNPQEGVRWYTKKFVNLSRDPGLMVDQIFF
jgi:hypothetical protein